MVAKDIIPKLTFAQYVQRIHPGFEVNWHHDVMFGELQDFADGLVDKLMFFMPPRCSKSLTCSKLFPGYLLYYYSSQEVLLFSFNQPVAQHLYEGVGEFLSTNEWKDLWDKEEPFHLPGFVNNKSRPTILLPDGSTLYSLPGESTFTGMGFDWVLSDELILNRNYADSWAVQNSLYDLYRIKLSCRQKGDTERSLHATSRWRKNDVIGRLVADGGWRVISFPAIAEEDEEWEGTDGKTHFRSRGHALWPEKHDLAQLYRIKEEIGDAEFEGLGITYLTKQTEPVSILPKLNGEVKNG